MNVSRAAQIWLDYHRAHSKENTIRNYEFIITKSCHKFEDLDLNEVSTNDIMDFMNQITNGRKPQTKRVRFSHLTAFFNFVKYNLDTSFNNPCDSPMLRKMFRAKSATPWDFIERETIDEIIFRTTKLRNRLILELMARGGMRIGEVLKLTPPDVQDRKLVIRDPKSGKEQEVIFIPQKVADRLKEYIRAKNFNSHDRIFQIGYEAARKMVRKAGEMVRISLRPHDLRRHSATYASRSNVPLEIVSILRHANLSTTTQRYLGTIDDTEAMSWIERLYR